MSDSTVTERYDVVGMTCQHCVGAVTAELSAVPGVQRVTVDLETGVAEVTSAQPLARDVVGAAVEESGYELAAVGRSS